MVDLEELRASVRGVIAHRDAIIAELAVLRVKAAAGERLREAVHKSWIEKDLVPREALDDYDAAVKP